jgi:uncharacterized protein YjbJ (UPF0337 family)
MKTYTVHIRTPKNSSHRSIGQRPVCLGRQSAIAWVAGVVITAISFLWPIPAMALAIHNAPGFNRIATMPSVAAMPNKTKAVAKDTEGKLESAYSDRTGDKERQVNEKANQATKSVAKKVGDATR